MALSNQCAASERLPDLARRASDAALGRRLQSHRGYLMILARMQIGRRLQGKVDPADVSPISSPTRRAVRREQATWLA
jgi:hypothetical protein